jgi:hypothetical protein
MHVPGLGLLLIIGAALAACSDPATEEPVSPKPGLYRLTMDRTGFGPAKVPLDPNKAEEQCVAAGESDLEWIYPMIQRKFCPECSCSTEDKTRTGNAIGARAVCPHDDSGTFGALEYAYRGVVSEDRVSLEGGVKSGLATALPPDATEEQKKDAAEVAKAWDSIVMSGRIERVGDCPA